MWKYKPFVMPEPAPLLEKDLPPGVRYRMMPSSPGGPPREFISATCLPSVLRIRVVDERGKRCFEAHGVGRGSEPVTILDWPEWCGPRPDQPRPITYADIREQAPTPGSNVVLAGRDGEEVWLTGSIATIPICGAISDCICLGYHYWEPDND